MTDMDKSEWVLVPREPTGGQFAAGQEVVWKGGARSGPVTVSVTTGTFGDIYRAMIAAAPPAPSRPSPGYAEGVEDAARRISAEQKKYLPGGPIDMKRVLSDLEDAIRALLPAGENTGEGEAVEATRCIACGQYDDERHDDADCPGSPHYNPAPASTEPVSGETKTVDFAAVNALADWFNALPDGGMGKEHFDRLVEVVSGLLSARRQADKGEPVAWEWWTVGRPDLTGIQRHKPALVPHRQMRPLYAAPPAPSEPSEGEVEAVAEAINNARYDTDMWRHLPRPAFAAEDHRAREYAFRLARAALRAAFAARTKP